MVPRWASSDALGRLGRLACGNGHHPSPVTARPSHSRRCQVLGRSSSSTAYRSGGSSQIPILPPPGGRGVSAASTLLSPRAGKPRLRGSPSATRTPPKRNPTRSARTSTCSKSCVIIRIDVPLARSPDRVLCDARTRFSIDTCRWFIENQKRRLGDQRDSDVHAPPVSARQPPNAGVDDIGTGGHPQRLVRRDRGSRASEPCDPRKSDAIFTRRQEGIERDFLGYEADVSGRRSCAGRPHDFDRPRVRFDRSGEQPDKRALAGPVRPHQDINLRGKQRRSHAAESLRFSITDTDTVQARDGPVPIGLAVLQGVTPPTP